MARFEAVIVPRSSTPGPAGRRGGIPRLRVKAPPADGKANTEAERALTELLGTRVRLVGGGRSTRKVFEADAGSAELEARLRGLFGD